MYIYIIYYTLKYNVNLKFDCFTFTYVCESVVMTIERDYSIVLLFYCSSIYILVSLF